MSPRSRLHLVLLGAAAALILASAPARAQDYSYQLRLRGGGYFPSDLPVNEGAIWGIELRDYMDARSGISYQIGYFNEKRTESMPLTSAPGAPIFIFNARVELVPITVSYFHVFQLSKADLYFGVGAGIYPERAKAAGLNKQLGVGVEGFGDFRILHDGTNAGFLVYGGCDLFPESRWGLMFEGRYHVVGNGYGGGEISTGAIYRF